MKVKEFYINLVVITLMLTSVVAGGFIYIDQRSENIELKIKEHLRSFERRIEQIESSDISANLAIMSQRIQSIEKQIPSNKDINSIVVDISLIKQSLQEFKSHRHQDYHSE